MGNKTVLSGVPAAYPRSSRPTASGTRRKCRIDWEEREQVWDKVKEEIREFQTEVDHMDKGKS